MNSSGDGFLIVLSDVKSADERDYLSWLTTEHAQERLGIPGFIAVRIFRRSIPGGHRYFIWYRLANSDVVDSPAYLDRLNHPTPWSRRIMPILDNFGRGGGMVASPSGNGTGGFIEVVELSAVPSNLPDAVAAEAMPDIVALHLLVTDSEKSAIPTSERALRTSDNSFAALLIVEANNETAKPVAQSFALLSVPASLFGGRYREVFSLANS